MPQVVLVLTEEAKSAANLPQQTPDARVETVDLSDANPDYNVLLDKIFEADSVQVW